MKCLLIILLSLMLISIVSADLIINPSPLNIKVKVGETQSFNITLNNTYNFKITNFTFSNLTGFTFPNIDLLPNQSKTTNFSVLRQNSGIFNINSKVSFKYLVDIPIGQTNHNISIIETGYSPNYLIVRKGDKVKWTNKDDITHTVTSATFDHSLLPNQSVEIQFNQIGEINYQDLILFFTGTINVINESTEEKVNNPAYDKNLIVNLEVTLNPTNLSITNNQDNYTVQATGSQEGVLNIKNTGNEIAERITLSSDPSWIIFDENNFNLNKDETNFVTYHISPIILRTEDTNKTYSISLSVSGSNIEQRNITIIIFIPYSNIFSDIGTNEGFTSWFINVFCPANPNLLFCNNTIQQSQGNKTIITDVQIPVNLTATEVYAMLKRIQRIEDSNERTNNEIKQIADQLGITVPELMKLIKESVTLQKNNEESSVSRIRSGWIIFIFVTICVCIIAIALVIRKRRYKMSIVEGGYNR